MFLDLIALEALGGDAFSKRISCLLWDLVSQSSFSSYRLYLGSFFFEPAYQTFLTTHVTSADTIRIHINPVAIASPSKADRAFNKDVIASVNTSSIC